MYCNYKDHTYLGHLGVSATLSNNLKCLSTSFSLNDGTKLIFLLASKSNYLDSEDPTPSWSSFKQTSASVSYFLCAKSSHFNCSFSFASACISSSHPFKAACLSSPFSFNCNSFSFISFISLLCCSSSLYSISSSFKWTASSCNEVSDDDSSWLGGKNEAGNMSSLTSAASNSASITPHLAHPDTTTSK